LDDNFVAGNNIERDIVETSKFEERKESSRLTLCYKHARLRDSISIYILFIICRSFTVLYLALSSHPSIVSGKVVNSWVRSIPFTYREYFRSTSLPVLCQEARSFRSLDEKVSLVASLNLVADIAILKCNCPDLCC